MVFFLTNFSLRKAAINKMIDVTGLADLPSDTIQYTNDCVTKYNIRQIPEILQVKGAFYEPDKR